MPKEREEQEQKRLPWSKEMDRFFFQQQDNSKIKKYSPEYYEFQEFYQRFLHHQSQSTSNDSMEEHSRKRARHESGLNTLKMEQAQIQQALNHFDTFKNKKFQQLRLKIEKDRQQLPVYQFKQEILQTIHQNQVTIIAAETGAGKSTQIPQYLMEAGYKRIACTQPRRIACISLAKRVSYETMNIYGSEIAYQIRFEGTRTEKTRVLFMTEGILLREMSGDSLLMNYDLILVDEVHERHVMCDFLLDLLKGLLEKRPDLKLVLMSATMNADLFSKYFGGAPLIEVPGKLFPVELEYVPLPNVEPEILLIDEKEVQRRQKAKFKFSIAAKSISLNAQPFLEILQRIDRDYDSSEGGDLLIFLSGMNEILNIAQQLQEYANENRRWLILKLHSALSIEEQDKVFDLAPPGIRKCILSTNIAETSVTIDGIRFVIDLGRVRELDFDREANLSRLSEFWISKASAKQRMGRAGRTGPGKCFRFYREEEFRGLNEFTIPEIMRVSLDQLALQIKALELGDPLTFDFIEKPPEEHLLHALQVLENVGALDQEYRLSALGHILSLLPVDVVLGKMLILGAVFDMIDPVIHVAAALSVPSPFLPLQSNSASAMKEQEKLKNRRQLESEHGDPFTLLNLFSEWLEVKATGQNSRKWCDQLGVQEQRLYEMTKLVTQFKKILNDALGIETEQQQQSGGNRKQFEKYQKRKHEKMQEFKERKVLRFETGRDEEQQFQPEHEENDDLNALEFNYKYDAQKWKNNLGHLKKLSNTEQQILKLIIYSGLYPNLAIPDEGNRSRKLQDQMYHTMNKRFCLLHPSSLFASNPEYLKSKGHSIKQKNSIAEQQQTFLNQSIEGDVDLTNLDLIQDNDLTIKKSKKEVEEVDTTEKTVSSQEFFCFLKILETQKPYLVQLLRIPALQSALLFGHQLDTSHDLTTLIVDEWLLIHFRSKTRFTEESKPIKEAVCKIFLMMFELREMWRRMVMKRLMNGQEKSFKGGIIGSDSFTNREELSEEEKEQVDLLLKTLPEPLLKFYYQNIKRQDSEDLNRHLDTSQRFLLLLERFLYADKLLDSMGVYYELDTLRQQDLPLCFPDKEQFSPLLSSALGFQIKQKKWKLGLRLNAYFNYSTVQYPHSYFQVQQRKEEHLVIGKKGNYKRVWECPKCKMTQMLTQEEIDNHLQMECSDLKKEEKISKEEEEKEESFDLDDILNPVEMKTKSEKDASKIIVPSSSYISSFSYTNTSVSTSDKKSDINTPVFTLTENQINTAPSQNTTNLKLYQCPKCKKEFNIKPLDFVKHKKSCTGS